MLPHNSPWTSGLSSIDPPKIDWSLSDWRSHKGEEREAHFPINCITWSPQLTFNGDQQKSCLLFSREGRQVSAFIPANGWRWMDTPSAGWISHRLSLNSTWPREIYSSGSPLYWPSFIGKRSTSTGKRMQPDNITCCRVLGVQLTFQWES